MTATRDAREIAEHWNKYRSEKDESIHWAELDCENEDLLSLGEQMQCLSAAFLALESRLAKAEKVVEAAYGVVKIDQDEKNQDDYIYMRQLKDALREYDAQGGGE